MLLPMPQICGTTFVILINYICPRAWPAPGLGDHNIIDPILRANMAPCPGFLVFSSRPRVDHTYILVLSPSCPTQLGAPSLWALPGSGLGITTTPVMNPQRTFGRHSAGLILVTKGVVFPSPSYAFLYMSDKILPTTTCPLGARLPTTITMPCPLLCCVNKTNYPPSLWEAKFVYNCTTLPLCGILQLGRRFRVTLTMVVALSSPVIGRLTVVACDFFLRVLCCLSLACSDLSSLPYFYNDRPGLSTVCWPSITATSAREPSGHLLRSVDWHHQSVPSLPLFFPPGSAFGVRAVCVAACHDRIYPNKPP